MADVLGTYYSPRESGLATVLGRSPDIGAIGDRANARMVQIQMVREKQRQKKVDDAYKILNKPYVTDQLWQTELSSKVKSYREDMTSRIMSGDVSGAVNAAMEAGQDLAAYAASAKQVAASIYGLKKSNTGKHKIYNIGSLVEAATDKMVNEDGGLYDPRDVDMNEVSVERLVLNMPGGSKHLNKKAVIDNVLDSDAFKEHTFESREVGDLKSLGKGFVGSQATSTMIKASPYVDIPPDGGVPTIKDAKGLMETGVLNVMLDDPAFARLVEDEVDAYFEKVSKEPKIGDRTIEIMGQRMFEYLPGLTKKDVSVETLNEIRADMTVDLLEGRQYGGGVFKRKEEMLVRQLSTGGGKMTERQMEYLGSQEYHTAMTSGDSAEIDRAIAYTAPQVLADMLPLGTVGPAEKVSGYKVNRDGTVTLEVSEYTKKDGKDAVAKRVDPEKMAALKEEEMELAKELKVVTPKTNNSFWRLETVQGKSQKQKDAIAKKEKIDARLAEIAREKTDRKPVVREITVDPSKVEDETIYNMHSESSTGRNRNRPFGSDERGTEPVKAGTPKTGGVIVDWKK